MAISYTKSEATQVVIKSAAETVNDSDTLQDDDQLKLAIAANETWVGEFVLFFDSGAAGSDGKVAITVPSGASITYATHAPRLQDQLTQSGSPKTASGSEAGFGIDEVVGSMCTVKFRVENGATAGDIQLQWAQSTADASDTTLNAGSYLSAVKG